MSTSVEILDAIRRGKNNYSKKDIQAETGLAWGTMCKGVDALLAADYIFARKEKVSGRGRGRPMIPLCVNSDAAFYIGIDIGSSSSRAVVCNLMFSTVYMNSTDTPEYKNPDSFFDWLCSIVETAIAESRIPRDKLAGIGLSVSGNVDYENGIIVSGANFGIKWGTNLHVGEVLSKKFNTRVYAVTSQAAAVWAEYHFGKMAGCKNLLTVGLGVGIGSGIVAGGHLLISQPGRPVGYIGHTLVPDNKYVCNCGFRGCLEAYSGGNFLAAVAKEELPNRPELHSAKALDEAAAAGDADAVRIMQTAASYNAVGIASMIQLYLPQALVFSGGQCRKDGFLFNQTLKAIRDILPEERRQDLKFSISELGRYQSALGAARLVYEKYFDIV